MEYLTFRAARQDCAIEAGCVRAILPWHELIPPIPGAPREPNLAGYASWRGETFSVIDLADRLGFPPSTRGRSPGIVVVETAVVEMGGLAGFTVDGISEVIHVRPRDFRGGKIRAGGRPRRVVELASVFFRVIS